MKGFFFLAVNLFLASLAQAGGARAKSPAEAAPGALSAFLVLSDEKTGKVYGEWEAPEGKEFAVEFIHSVNNSPVREMFSVEGGVIRGRAVLFFSFGAGMQSTLEEGERFVRDGEGMIITGSKRTWEELRYIVGTVSDHVLFIGDERIGLRDLCGRNAQVVFSIRKGGGK
ncbi:MAG: DUF1850 domain-containing protein [Treponema sp.]|nr:DUF1850 domain-containing protein [Treponema sp.]